MKREKINSEELNIFYSLIGEGIWHLQNVEDALHTYIAIKKDIKVRGSIEPGQAKKLLLNHRKNTLGTSLRISCEANVLVDTLQQRLEKFKEERDWLVHRSVYQHRQDLYVNEKRNALMGRIKAFSVEARMLQKLIAGELEEFVVNQGVSREWIYQEAEKQVEEFEGRPGARECSISKK